jgi:hypothetical protein
VPLDVKDPSVTTFKLRFSQFSDYDDTTIGFALEEAELFVSNGFKRRGRAVGILYLAAHILAINEQATETDGQDIKHESIGRFTVTYKTDTSADTASAKDLSQTVYGRRYLHLLTLSIKPFHVIGHKRPWANAQFFDRWDWWL